MDVFTMYFKKYSSKHCGRYLARKVTLTNAPGCIIAYFSLKCNTLSAIFEILHFKIAL